MAFGALAVTAGGASIKMASDFQSSMQKINGLVGISQKQVDAWSSQILDLASTLPQSPNELAKALYFVTSAGIKTSDAMGVLKASAKAAAAGLGDTQTVADAVTSAVNAYGIKNLSAAKATDIMVNAVKLGKLEADSLAGVLGRVIPVTSQMGVSFDQAAAAMAAMSTTGADAEESATSLQAILSGLLKPSAQGAKALASVGLSFAGIRDEIRNKGLFAALMDVRTSFQGNDEQLAKVIPNVRALRGFLALTSAQADSTRQIFDKMANSTGATDAAFKSASETADFKFKTALSSLQAAAIRMGAAILPVAAGMADAFSKLLTPIAKNRAAFGVLATGVVAFAVTAKAAMMAFAVSARAALVTSVVGIAILALSVAITELITHWNTVFNTMKNVTRTVCNAITGAFRAVQSFIIEKFVRPVTNGLLNFFGWITKGAASAFGWVPLLGPKLRNAARAFDQFRTDVNRAFDKLSGKTVTIGANFQVTAGANTDFPIVKGTRRATGGIVQGPGTPTSDSIPAYLSNGEYVVQSSAVRKYGRGFLDNVNAQRYASGGLVMRTALPPMDDVKLTMNKAMLAVAQKWAKSMASIGSVGGSGVTRWSGLVLQVLAMLGQSSGWLPTVLRRMNQESGGNTLAVNLWDINAKNGTPSLGLMQVIQPTFDAYAGPFHGLGIANPLANVYAGLNYALHRYGSLAALNRPGGYDLGGVLRPGLTLAMNSTGHDEYVVNPALSRGGGDTYITVPVTVQGHTLATKQEIARAVSDALAYGQTHGVSVPYVRK